MPTITPAKTRVRSPAPFALSNIPSPCATSSAPMPNLLTNHRPPSQRRFQVEFDWGLAHCLPVNQNSGSKDPCAETLGETRKPIEPCSIVIFGASGDLTSRKLIPALYHVCKEKQMPSDFRIIGFARREKTDDSWRQELRQALDQFSRTKPVDEQGGKELSKRIFYCQGALTEDAPYGKLEQQTSGFGNPALRTK